MAQLPQFINWLIGQPTVINPTMIMGGVGNITNAQTGAYAVQDSDTGTTLSLGGDTFYTLTFNATSNYDSNFIVLVVNTDTTRAKYISISGENSFYLWPEQSCFVFISNNIWTVAGLPQFFLLTSATTFYVDGTNGSDTNDGLAPTTGAFQTIQRAINVVSQYVNAQGHVLTVSVAAGTYVPTGGSINLLPVAGVQAVGSHNELILTGETSGGIPTGNTIIVATSGNCIHALNNGAAWRVQGFLFEAASGVAISAEFDGKLYLGNNIYGGCAGGHINSAYDSKVELVDNYSISGASGSHYIVNYRGLLLSAGGITVTMVSSPNFSGPFCEVVDNSYFAASGITFSGAIATGVQRYYAINGGGIDTGGGGATYFPGSIAGSVTNPAWYA